MREVWPGRAFPLGATWDGEGTNFSIFSEHAERVELCLFAEDGREVQIALPEIDGFVWHGYVAGLPLGTKYGFRVHGPFDPDAGLRWHPLKRGKERPLELPDHRALVFGDRIVGVDGGLRYWTNDPVTDKRKDYFRRVTSPQLAQLLEIDFDRALVTHGEPVMKGARRALEDALAGEPWYHRGS
jgi:hypothetical protein